jgi:hypothetical protein
MYIVKSLTTSCLKVLVGFHYKWVAMFLGSDFKIAKGIEIPAKLWWPWQPIGKSFAGQNSK